MTASSMMATAQVSRSIDYSSGTGSFSAATLVGPASDVTGVDMTEAQLAKAEDCARPPAVTRSASSRGHFEDLPLAAARVTW